MWKTTLFTASVALIVSWSVSPAHVFAQPLVFDQPQTAGIAGFRGLWDEPVPLAADGAAEVSDDVIKDKMPTAVWDPAKRKEQPGAIAFDALQRSVLIRFPGAAQAISDRLAKGEKIEKVELVLPYRDAELWPPGNADYVGPQGYTVRKNWGTDGLYRGIVPRWHAVAWALRRPWSVDAQSGPTFNAAVNGSIYWTKFGAQDLKNDRYPTRFGPAEVSSKVPDGRLDLTPLLSDAAFGETLAARLRAFEERGVIVQKEEIYDHLYFTGCYEWSTATGGRGILVNTPKLIVTFAEGDSGLNGPLPPATDLPALAAKAKSDGSGGKPTAIIPSTDELETLAKQYATKPQWMAEPQWQHVRELFALENAEKAAEPFWFQFVPDYIINRLRESYRDPAKEGVQFKPADPSQVNAAWVDQIVGRPPRGWSGFESAREMTQWYLYKDALPGTAQDAIRTYWTAWLMPDRETAHPEEARRNRFSDDGKLIHPMADDPRVGGTDAQNPDPLKGRFDTYYTKTGDWRGNKSFFRSGFCYTQSTQNFNTTSAAGALLAGAIISSDRAMADGRNGIEQFPLRMYSWSDGSGQEHIDHYYYAVTLSGNKAVADFSATPYDRLIGQSLLVKNMEELVAAYHPGLRTFIAGSSRTSLEFLLGTQDGLQFILHTLSKSGALRDKGVAKLPGEITVVGHEVPPRVVAQQTLAGPWAPEWVAPMVDDKPLPFLSKHTQWNGGTRTAYLADNYGLFSSDVGEGRIQTMAQWRRVARQVENSPDLGTLDVRFGINETRFVNDGGGYIAQRGSHSTLQDRNKLIFLTSPKTWPGGFHGGGVEKDLKSMQASIALFTLQPKPTWEIFVDGKKVDILPITAKQGQRITIHDGVTYLGVIPLPCTDLGRDAEVVIEEGKEQKYDQYRAIVKASLVINSYLYKRDTAFPEDKDKWIAAGKAHGGFIIELGDQTEYGDFATFQEHLADAKLDVSFDDATNTATVKYQSGKDAMEASSITFIPNKEPDTETGAASISRKLINGKDPSLAAGLERDTPYAQQAIGRAEKNGATLLADEGRRVFLLTEPQAGVYCGWNPLPDLTTLNFSTPGDITVTADGKVGLTRIVARPASNSIEIDHAFKPGQENEEGIARSLLIAAPKGEPKITVNGKAFEKLSAETRDGKTVYIVPLH